LEIEFVKRFLTCWAAVVSVLVLMGGCSTLDRWMSGDKVDYRSQGGQTAGLDVPPDLTQLQRDSRSDSGAPVSAAAVQGAGAPAEGFRDKTPPVAMQSAGNVRLERRGQQRWLSTPQAPEQVWPQLQAFSKDQGFALAVNQADAGVMETEWTENRDAAPKEGVRGAMSRFLGALVSSGERDKFRLRLERSPQGGSEVYVSHRGLVEVLNAQKDASSWQPRPADPQLEAQMLTRLMVKLGGGSEESAKAALNQAADSPAKARLLADVKGAAGLQVDDAFDAAWRRVGVALDRSGFTVEDQDRDQGLYFVRYADNAQADKGKPGLLSRLLNWGGREADAKALQRYRVWVQSAGVASSKVSVLNAQGVPDHSATGQKIAAVLLDDLK
jgi:outer membrane protein assembly factor BamC